MLHIHLTLADLARVRVMMLGPLAETQLSLDALQRRDSSPLLDGWRSRTRFRLSADVRALAHGIATPGGPLDLFTVVGPATDLAEGIDRLLGAPQQLRDELVLYPPPFHARLPEWVTRTVSGQSAAAQRFSAALQAAYQATVAPYWDRIRDCLTAERTAVTQLMADDGIGGMLGSLHPSIHWQAPVLTVDYKPVMSDDSHLHLMSRGLILVPSLFARQILVFAPTDGEDVVLIYPLTRDALATASVFTADARRGQSLGSLLGHTRAAVLQAADGATTGDIARRLGISAAGASQHATVLRQAGLITSRRHSQTVRHTLTPLGQTLIDRTTAHSVS
jgi:DNA-binding transcriptional ArsR family regulator